MSQSNVRECCDNRNVSSINKDAPMFREYRSLVRIDNIPGCLSSAPLDENVDISRPVVAVDQLNPTIVTGADCRGDRIGSQVPALGQDHSVAGAAKASVPDELIPIHKKSIWVGVSLSDAQKRAATRRYRVKPDDDKFRRIRYGLSDVDISGCNLGPPQCLDF